MKSVFAFLLVAAMALGAQAGDFPEKPVQFIVNKGPGGGSDTVTRMYAACLEKLFKANTVVINRPGGDGVVGTNEVVKSKADGYTLFLTSPNEIVYAIVNGAGVEYTEESFTNIAGLNIRGSILAVRKDAPFKDFASFIEYAKANPRKVTIGTPGGTQMGNVAEMAKTLGIELTIINGGNGNQLFTQVAGGHIDMGFIGAQFYPKFMDEGCTVIAQTVASRTDGWENVPTVKELGYEFEFDVRMFLCGPAGIPAETVRQLEKITSEMFSSGELTQMFIKAGEKPKYQNVDDLNAYLKTYYPAAISAMKEYRDSKKK